MQKLPHQLNKYYEIYGSKRELCQRGGGGGRAHRLVHKNVKNYQSFKYRHAKS